MKTWKFELFLIIFLLNNIFYLIWAKKLKFPCFFIMLKYMKTWKFELFLIIFLFLDNNLFYCNKLLNFHVFVINFYMKTWKFKFFNPN